MEQTITQGRNRTSSIDDLLFFSGTAISEALNQWTLGVHFTILFANGACAARWGKIPLEIPD
jgi:hypothetical protein